MSTLKSVAYPIVALVTLLIIATIFSVTIMMKGGEMSNQSVTLYNVSFAYILAWGVELDRKAIGRSAPFEYGAFMFFLWWVLFPVYLFQTRRWRGLAIAFFIFFISSLPGFVTYGVSMLYDPAL
jgi:hypothetical protein